MREGEKREGEKREEEGREGEEREGEGREGESEGEREEEEEEVGDEERQINYVVGDVTQPQHSGSKDAIIVHCVGGFVHNTSLLLRVAMCWCVCIHVFNCLTDDLGRWGKGGLFSAISARSSQPQTQYELAGRMKGDLNNDTCNLIVRTCTCTLYHIQCIYLLSRFASRRCSHCSS